jgi:hypothetical protein
MTTTSDDVREVVEMSVEKMRSLIPYDHERDSDNFVILEVLVSSPREDILDVIVTDPEIVNIIGEQDYAFRENGKQWLICIVPDSKYDLALSWVTTLKAAGLDAKIETSKRHYQN